MYKLIATDLQSKKHVRTFVSAIDARDWYNDNLSKMKIIEIYEIEKWTRERMNAHAQMEEECLAFGKGSIKDE